MIYDKLAEFRDYATLREAKLLGEIENELAMLQNRLVELRFKRKTIVHRISARAQYYKMVSRAQT